MAVSFTDWNNSESLQHYGVLGMKWGVRKAQKSGGNYEYKSHATKKYERKAARAQARGKIMTAEKMANRAKRSRELDRLEQKGASNVSTGKALATRMIFGSDMSKAYHQNLAMMGTHVGKASAGQKFTARVMSYYGGTMASRALKAAYIRKGEKGLGARIGNKMIEGAKLGAKKIDQGNALLNSQDLKKKRR